MNTQLTSMKSFAAAVALYGTMIATPVEAATFDVATFDSLAVSGTSLTFVDSGYNEAGMNFNIDNTGSDAFGVIQEESGVYQGSPGLSVPLSSLVTFTDDASVTGDSFLNYITFYDSGTGFHDSSGQQDLSDYSVAVNGFDMGGNSLTSYCDVLGAGGETICDLTDKGFLSNNFSFDGGTNFDQAFTFDTVTRSSVNYSENVSAVPEPSSGALLAIGALALAGMSYRRSKDDLTM